SDVLLHARQRHAELPGELGDRSVRMPEPLENAAPGGVRERGERGIESCPLKLNHVVQYMPVEGRAQGGGCDPFDGVARVEILDTLDRPAHTWAPARSAALAVPGRHPPVALPSPCAPNDER